MRSTAATDFIKGDWDKTVFLDNVHTDNLMVAFLSLGAEVWTMKRHILVLEEILETKHGGLKKSIDSFVPSSELYAGWQQERDDYIDRVFEALTRTTGDTTGDFPQERVSPLSK